jgi:hypothetical protein
MVKFYILKKTQPRWDLFNLDWESNLLFILLGNKFVIQKLKVIKENEKAKK